MWDFTFLIGGLESNLAILPLEWEPWDMQTSRNLAVLRLLPAAFIVAFALALGGCAVRDLHYRGRTFAQEGCGTPSSPIQVDASSVAGAFHGFERASKLAALECSLQSFNVGHPLNYDIAYVELLDSGESSTQRAQVSALKAYLEAAQSQSLSVYVFVHGWRHNADVGDDDVSRFHTILALMKSYWRDAGQPDRRVLGVYIGWRGASVREPGWGEVIDLAASALSFPGRKSQSDIHAARLRELLLSIEGQIQSRKSERVPSSLVVIGHSLGGNMVLRATAPVMIDRMRMQPKGSVVPGFGSLVVLLNPASELSEWIKVQEASRLHSGILEPDRNSYLTPSECGFLAPETDAEARLKCASAGTSWVYPSSQPPVLVSFTTSKHFNDVDAQAGTTDFATSLAFPLSQRIFKWPRDSEDLIALGHALPVRAFDIDGRPDHSNVGNRLYGITHEIEVNQGAGAPGSYGEILRSASQGRKGFCVANQDLIRQSIMNAVERARKENPAARGRGWNQERLWLDAEQKRLQLNVKHQAARGACSAGNAAEMGSVCEEISGGWQVPRLGDIYDPYWNVAVHPNLIESHGRYVSQNLWCFVQGLATP